MIDSTYRRLRYAWLPSVLIAGVLLTTSACSPPPPPEVSQQGGSGGSGDNCEDRIASALSVVDPARLGVTSDVSSAVGLLNDWMQFCAPQQGVDATIDADNQAMLQELLPEDVYERISSDRFVARDGKHLRNCLWAKAVNSIALHTENDLDHIVELFDYVVRNVALADSDDGLPLTMFDIAFFGRGTAADRAWVFAELLRQIRIEAAIIHPAGVEQISESEKWLVGAFLNNEIYLFDPRLGSAIPALDDETATTATVHRPATLTEAAANDEVLRQLDFEGREPYPLTSADLADCRLKVIGDVGFWAPRMNILQSTLAGDQSVIVYDSLESNATGNGLIYRVSDYHEQVDAEEVGVWMYPERNAYGFENLDARQQETFAILIEPFFAPLEIKLDPNQGVPRIGRPLRNQHKSRLLQLVGDYEKAIQGFQRMRIDAGDLQLAAEQNPDKFRPPPRLLRMYQRAAEDAMFWIGMCQFEQQGYESAAETFRDYLNRYTNGSRAAHCRFVRAMTLAKLDRIGEAVELLEAAPSSDPQAAGYALLISRWKDQSPPPSDEVTESQSDNSEAAEGENTPETSSDESQPDDESSPPEPADAESAGDAAEPADTPESERPVAETSDGETGDRQE